MSGPAVVSHAWVASALMLAGVGASRPSRPPTTSASDRTTPVSSPLTIAASGAVAGGARSRSACCRATRAIGKTPRIDWIVPSSDSSPRSRMSPYSRRGRRPLAASTPTAMGRSYDVTRLRTLAGARLIVTRWAGNSKPEFRIALRTRSRLSRTLESGSPTILKAGRPNETSTSTSDASIPNSEAERNRASTYEKPQRPLQPGALACTAVHATARCRGSRTCTSTRRRGVQRLGCPGPTRLSVSRKAQSRRTRDAVLRGRVRPASRSSCGR